MIHVLTLQDGSFQYMMTYAQNPVIAVSLYPNIGQVKAGLLLQVTNAQNSFNITKPFQVMTFNNSLSVASNNKANKQLSGLVNLEDFMTISGVYSYARLDGGNHGDADLIQRLNVYSQYKRPSGNDLFQHIESFQNMNLALHVDQSNSSVFTLFDNNNNYVSTFLPFPGTGVQSYCFVSVSTLDDSILLAYTTTGPNTNQIEILAVNGAGIITMTTTAQGNCGIMKMVKRDMDQNMYLVCHETQDWGGDVIIFNVIVAQGFLSAAVVTDIPNVATFGVGFTNQNLYVAYTTNDDPYDARFETCNMTPTMNLCSGQSQSLLSSEVKLQASVGRWPITKIECGDPGLFTFTCILDTYSTSLVELIYNEQGNLTANTYEKVPNYDGRYFVVSKDYFAQQVKDQKYQDEHLIVYKRLQSGGSPRVYSQVGVTGPAPFTLNYDNGSGSTFMAYATSNVTAPVNFVQIGQLSVSLQTTNLDLSQIYLVLHNPYVNATITLQAIFDGAGSNEGPTSPAFFIILLALLILLGIAYTIYARLKAEPILDEASMLEGNYKIADAEEAKKANHTIGDSQA
jgi:hypothetical protein